MILIASQVYSSLGMMTQGTRAFNVMLFMFPPVLTIHLVKEGTRQTFGKVSAQLISFNFHSGTLDQKGKNSNSSSNH